MRRITNFLAGAFLGTLLSFGAAAQERLRLALDTNPNHVRNINAERFAEALKQKLGDRIAPEIFPSAQLYRDRDVPRALRQNSVEMGIPGTWQLDGIAPNTAITGLPMFYGVSPEIVHRIVDGPLGQEINKRIEDRLRVKVLGRWYDLGYNHFFGAKQRITRYEDLQGMKIRSPGGSANAARFRAFGGNPVLIPWPDLPLAMSQGVVDGLITSYESAFTAKLWDAGLSNAFEDRQIFAQYVPMLSMALWNKLSPAERTALTESWEASVDVERRDAAAAQDKAREELAAHGVDAIRPSEDAVTAARQRLMAAQDEIVAELKMDRDLVEQAMQGLRAAGVRF